MEDSSSEEDQERQVAPPVQVVPSVPNELAFLLDRWEDYFDPKHERPASLNEKQNDVHFLLVTFHRLLAKQPLFFGLLQRVKLSKGESSPYVEFDLSFKKLADLVKGSYKQSAMLSQLDRFVDEFESCSEVFVSALNLALWHFVKAKEPVGKKVFVGVQDYPIKEISKIQSHEVNYFVSLRVVVVRVGQVKLMAKSATFVCQLCRGESLIYFSNGIYKPPQSCKARLTCKSKSFLENKYNVKYVQSQRLKVQEIDCDGKTPRALQVELRENLVKKATSGQVICISGVLKSLDEHDKINQAIFAPVLIANSIQNGEIQLDHHRHTTIVGKMCQDPNIFASLIKSFCPAIYGRELVKAGILLSLASYSCESQETRGSHILLVGDPGLGKSQLLKFASSLLPNSLYVSGNSISTNGLTAIVSSDRDGTSLQAGALVLCDEGICAIDQFDKIADSSALLEVAEQQTVSVAKSGIVCQLRARVSILASANPKSGMFEKNKTLKDNIKISNAILSRFDMIFLLIDLPNQKTDRVVSEHIVNVPGYVMQMRHGFQKPATSQHSSVSVADPNTDKDSLAEFYHKTAKEHGRLYDHEELKSYLRYVRHKLPQPRLTPQAAETIKYYYMSMRDKPPCEDMPVTARQLESLVRLCQARARLERMTEVPPEIADVPTSHIQEIIQFVEESMYHSFREMSKPQAVVRNPTLNRNDLKPTGQLSLPKQTKLFMQRLIEVSEEQGRDLFSLQELVQIANQLQMKVGDFRDYLDLLNERGNFLRQAGKYKLVMKYLT